MITWFEVFLGLLSNLQTVGTILFIVAFLVAFILGIAAFAWDLDSYDKEAIARIHKFFRRSIYVTALLLPFVLVPSFDKLWEVRIALLKFQLASPENIQKGSETIERVAKSLECKYLNSSCPKEGDKK